MHLGLTPKQQRVCELLTRGWGNKEIARKMDLSPRTIEDHRAEILQKAQVRNVVELTRLVYGISE